MNRAYCIAYLGKVEAKWCNTVKHNNNPTGAVATVLLPVFFHNGFLSGKKNLIFSDTEISLAQFYCLKTNNCSPAWPRWVCTSSMHGEHLGANPKTPTGICILQKRPKTLFWDKMFFNTQVLRVYFACNSLKNSLCKDRLKKEKTAT